jgi:hypothetical protein
VIALYLISIVYELVTRREPCFWRGRFSLVGIYRWIGHGILRHWGWVHCRNGGGESLRSVRGGVKVVLCIQGPQFTASVDRDAQFFKSQSRLQSRKRRMQDAKEGSSFSGLKSSATTFLSFPENKDSVKRRNLSSRKDNCPTELTSQL